MAAVWREDKRTNMKSTAGVLNVIQPYGMKMTRSNVRTDPSHTVDVFVWWNSGVHTDIMFSGLVSVHNLKVYYNLPLISRQFIRCFIVYMANQVQVSYSAVNLLDS